MHKKGSAFINIGLLLIAAALLLTGYNIWDGNRAEQASLEIAQVLWNKIPNYAQTHPGLVTETPTTSSSAGTQVPDLSGQQGGEAGEDAGSADSEDTEENGISVDLETEFLTETLPDIPDREMPTVLIDGYRYIGVLDVDSLKLSLPVMDEWDYERLRISPCRFAGNIYQNNLVICAHNYAKHFQALKFVPIDTKIRFTDMDGNVFNYTVISVETVGPNAVEQMINGDWDLTLFTCNTGGQTRCAIRCSLIPE